METRKCNQTKCGYNYNGCCKNCEVCNCEPNLINENCDRCWNCENDDGILRWGNDDDINEDIKEENKPIEMKIK